MKKEGSRDQNLRGGSAHHHHQHLKAGYVSKCHIEDLIFSQNTKYKYITYLFQIYFTYDITNQPYFGVIDSTPLFLDQLAPSFLLDIDHATNKAVIEQQPRSSRPSSLRRADWLAAPRSSFATAHLLLEIFVRQAAG